MNNLQRIGIALTLVMAGFFSGKAYEAWRYNDLCLDMGGGKNPGGHPICVLDESKGAD
uniref:hypothetical protein n=1 Tax=uncultured Halomonas sp. TaxID=173971 RepID=UPI00260CF9BC|nr:hypothetical protein [uncultured Halomonas sp.]